jgi:hypothetical protein
MLSINSAEIPQEIPADNSKICAGKLAASGTTLSILTVCLLRPSLVYSLGMMKPLSI